MGAARASTRTAWERIRASSVAGNVSFAGTPIWKMAGPWVISWYISMNEPGSGGFSDLLSQRRLRRAVEFQLKRLGHGLVVHDFCVFLVLFTDPRGAFIRAKG